MLHRSNGAIQSPEGQPTHLKEHQSRRHARRKERNEARNRHDGNQRRPKSQGCGYPETTSDANGKYQFSFVPSGAYRLNACCGPAPVQPFQKRMTVHKQPVHIDLVVRKYIEVQGQVEVPGWVPPFGVIEWYAATVTAKRVADNSLIDALLSPSATFTFLLREGEYRIEINNPDNFIIKSMTFGSSDILKNTLKIEGPTKEKIKIILVNR
jgi:hypothetical protein